MNKELIGKTSKHLQLTIEKYLNKNTDGIDITSSQSMIMHYLFLHRDEVNTLKTLADAFHLAHPTVVGIIQRLKDNGYVETEVSTNDRRFKTITLTDKALKHKQKMKKIFDKMEKTIKKDLDEEDVKLWISLTLKMIANLKGEDIND